MSSPKTEQGFADKVADQLKDVFGSVERSQRAYYAEHPNKRPSLREADSIISSYANQNAIIAGGCSMVPGPWGMLTLVPEIVLIVRNQLKMIYDLGVAHNKESKLNEDVLLGVFAFAMGSGAMGVVTIKGSQVLVRRTSLRVIQRIITWLGGKITQRVLKQFISRWLPVVGAMAMAIWARQSTVSVGQRAAEVFAKDFVYSDEEAQVDE